MAKNFYDIALALAGVNQSASLVHELANTGECNNEAFEASINSVLVLNPTTTLDVFGGQERFLKVGMEATIGVLNGSNGMISASIIRYGSNIITLANKLLASPDTTSSLSEQLQQISDLDASQQELDRLVYHLADIYVATIAPLGNRIQIGGTPATLTRPEIQAKIRSILLAGIRAAVLWIQVGGTRWQFFFRKLLLQQAQQIMHRI